MDRDTDISFDEVLSRMLALPLLLIIYLGQHFQYLDQTTLTHNNLVEFFRKGAGVQGYCGGMMAAISVACAYDEEEIVANACKAIRAAVGIGGLADTMYDNPTKQS